MAENSSIEWCMHTFNPWTGCAKVSLGCKNCYAETLMDKRYHKAKWGPQGTRVVASEAAWKLPLRWDRAAKTAGERHRVFCASLADVFEDWQGPMQTSGGDYLYCDPDGSSWSSMIHHPDEAEDQLDPRESRSVRMADVRCRLFSLIDATTSLDWLLLTKRPENAARMMGPDGVRLYARADRPVPNPQPNIWIGCSLENQDCTFRIDHLRCTPAAVRFLSIEPLLSPLHDLDLSGIDWVIVGGESGPGARPCNIEWIRSIVRQCEASGTACFVKQLGKLPIPESDDDRCRLAEFIPGWHSKGGDIEQWPEDLRVREMPVARS